MRTLSLRGREFEVAAAGGIALDAAGAFASLDTQRVNETTTLSGHFLGRCHEQNLDRLSWRHVIASNQQTLLPFFSKNF